MLKRIPIYIRECAIRAFAIWTGTVSFLFTVWPNLTVYRWSILSVAFTLVFGGYLLRLLFHKKITIRNDNYEISVEYGDLFEMNGCKVVIPFDECFTVTVGNLPGDINAPSVCGQFLKRHLELDQKKIVELIAVSGLSPCKGTSKFKNKTRYESGRVLQYQGIYLLMAFAKLDKDGRGELSFEEYCRSLSVLWDEIDKYYGQSDVCIPVIGTGTTRIGDGNISKQEMLDILICSYITSRRKIRSDARLRIICPRKGGININKVMFS